MTSVEAAALSAIVSSTLKIVGNKLAPLLIKEYSSIVGVKEDLQELHGSVEEINYWLETVGYNTMGSGPSFHWLKKLKDIAYEVDDVVDKFQVQSEKYDTNGDGNIVSKYLHTIPKSFISQCKTANKIKTIKKRFAQIVKQRSDYLAITNSLSVDLPVCPKNSRTVEISSLPYVDEASVVGRNKDKQLIISKLEETDDRQKIKIISVIGLGGTGKTTLAKLVFNDDDIIKKHFKYRLWVHVSQEFDVKTLIMKMFEALVDNNLGQYSLQYMSKTISDKLVGKRFLVVLDDVWIESQFQWEKFTEFLVSIGAPGSRILVTTRSTKVAETVGSTETFKLPLLSEDSSWQLFIKIYGIASNGLASEFIKVGKEIVHKCGGVPLAIKALACVLRGKERMDQWEAVRDNNLLYVEGEEHRVSACLWLSYLHLPSNIKQCFTICSVFPKGHKLDKEELIDLWIAQDMISLVPGVDYLEDIGHMCFNSLVQMCFLQDVHEYGGRGRVTCMMHDLVHDLAQSILGDEFSLVPEAATSSTKRCRYFSLTEESRNLLSKTIFEKARVMFISKCDDFTFGKTLNNAKHLRSIIVKYNHAASLHRAIVLVKNLRYLSISGQRIETLPEAISNVWSLQALHVTNCPCLLMLPESIGSLQKLRTLNMSGCTNMMSLPDSIGDCHMISRIDLSHCKKLTDLPNSIGKNKTLRVLRLGYTAIRNLPSSITELGKLECLDLEFCHELLEVPEGIGQLSRLQNLNRFVVGVDEKSAGISELANVARNNADLYIGGIKNVMDPDDAHKALLKEKKKLQLLRLNWGRNDVDEANKEIEQAVLDCLEPPSGIIELYIGGYCGGKYAHWMLKQVNSSIQGLPQFPYLTKMTLWGFPNLKHLDHLMELPSLEVLCLVDLPSLESMSGGPFPSLVKLVMGGLYSLGEVCMVKQRTLEGVEKGRGFCKHNHQHLRRVEIGGHIPYLSIKRCPKLIVRLYFPCSMEYFILHRSNKKMLQSPGQGQGQGSTCLSTVRPLFDFRHLKSVRLDVMTSPSHFGHSWVGLLQNMPALEHWDVSGPGRICRSNPNSPYMAPRPSDVYYSLKNVSFLIPDYEWYLDEWYVDDVTDGNCNSDLWDSQQLLQPLGQCQVPSSSPSKNLDLCDVRGLVSEHGWELLEHMMALVPFVIFDFSGVQTKLPMSCYQVVELPEGISNLEKCRVWNLKVVKAWDFGGMPIGIGQLSQLQKQGLFVVGNKVENFEATSKFEFVYQICEELRITGISHGMDPNDAQMACLKQKSRLKRLDLQWIADDTEEVNAEFGQAVLDGLEPPPGIKELLMDGYLGSQYAGWMQNQVVSGVQGPAPFPFLRVMELRDFPNLNHLQGLVELPCLELLVLKGMPSLESISGGPFPSLVKMEMNDLPCLGEVWMVAEGTMTDRDEGGVCCTVIPQLGQVRVGNCLAELVISDCPKLGVKPHLPPSLQHLLLCHRSEQLLQSPGQCRGSPLSTTSSHLKWLQLSEVTGLGSGYGWELLQHLTALESLEISHFSGLQTKLPESLWSLTSLLSLKVYEWSNIRVLPESLGELRSLQELTIEYCGSLSSLPQSMGQLTSLKLLKIGWCDALHQLPDFLGELCSLEKLEIIHLPGLTCLPQSIWGLTTSLHELKIYACPGIKSLPEGIKGLTALKELQIYNCPDLVRRCKRETGEDWHLISHIPDVKIGFWF